METESPKNVVTIKNLNFSYDKGKPNIIGLDCVIKPNSKVSVLNLIVYKFVWVNFN